MTEFFTPLELLAHVEASGYRLRIRDGKLVGPPGLAPEIVEQIKYHKEALITLLTYQCPRCNQPVRDVMNTDNVLYIECVVDPAHFSHVIPKKRGQPSFVSSGGEKPARCVECGATNDGEWKYCARCWLRLFEEDAAAQAASGE